MITQKDIEGLFQAVNDMAELRSENKALKKENEFYKELLTKQLILPVVSKAKRTACRCGHPYSEKDLQDGMCNKCCAPTTEY